MKHKVSELTGGLLDAAVAMAEGHKVCQLNGVWCSDLYGQWTRVRNMREWRYVGPIIEREHIAIEHGPTEDLTNSLTWKSSPEGRPWHAWVTTERPEGGGRRFPAFATTPQTAAMRAYVCSKLGEEVELP